MVSGSCLSGGSDIVVCLVLGVCNWCGRGVLLSVVDCLCEAFALSGMGKQFPFRLFYL